MQKNKQKNTVKNGLSDEEREIVRDGLEAKAYLDSLVKLGKAENVIEKREKEETRLEQNIKRRLGL